MNNPKMCHNSFFFDSLIYNLLSERSNYTYIDAFSAPGGERAIDAFGIIDSYQTSTPSLYNSIATVGEIRVYQRADFQSGSRVLKKVF